MRSFIAAGIVVIALTTALGAQRPGAQRAGAPLASEPACQTLTMASAGGPMPRNPSVMVLRWLGTSNYELAYRDQIVLFDAFYDRTPPARPLGFKPEEVQKATVILVGHGHFDHISDAASVAARTGAPVYGGPPSAEYLRKAGLPARLIKEVKGGETAELKGMVVEAVLAQHADLSGEKALAIRKGWAEMQQAGVRPRTPEEQTHEDAIRARGTSDPRVITEGTIAYLITLDNGFKLIYQDSGGPVTDAERKLMQRIGSTDVAIVAYGGWGMVGPQLEATMPLVRLFKPKIFLPDHHDETGGVFPDLPVYPLFMAIRDELPDTRTVSPLYRSPICINTDTRELFVGR